MLLAARASEEVGELVRQRHHLAVHGHVCEATRAGPGGDGSAGSKGKGAQHTSHRVVSRARAVVRAGDQARQVGEGRGRRGGASRRAGRRAMGRAMGRAIGRGFASCTDQRTRAPRFSNPNPNPNPNRAGESTEVVAHRDARHGHNGAIGLQGADDLEEALVHLVVLVLPRPVMAAVDRGRGACRREGVASSARVNKCAVWRGRARRWAHPLRPAAAAHYPHCGSRACQRRALAGLRTARSAGAGSRSESAQEWVGRSGWSRGAQVCGTERTPRSAGPNARA